MLSTATSHFEHDLSRSKSLFTHASTQVAGELKDDLHRSALMIAVGAVDAFFSDAYADVICRTLRAKEIQPEIAISDALLNIKVPAITIIREANDGWRWRMAAREMIEKENVLSVEKIQKLFNPFFRKGHKLFNQDSIEHWILDRKSRVRMFGITPTNYRKLTTSNKSEARKDAVNKLKERMGVIFQRRHDCIHNCDRPKSALQPVVVARIEKAIYDIEFLVNQSSKALLKEYPIFLKTLGFTGSTRNKVGAKKVEPVGV